MGHLDIAAVSYTLPDGRPLLDGVSLRVGEGSRTVLVGPNGTGKTTLLRLVAGDIAPTAGAITGSGGRAVMRQDVGSDAKEVRDLLLAVSAPAVRAAAELDAAELDAAELAMMEAEDEPTQMRYAQALADWADVGGYDAEVFWDVVCQESLGAGYDAVRWRDVATLSGGERKRLVLEALLRGPEEVLLLDEPDNALDVPGKRWLERALVESPKTVLLISHDRELLAQVATRVATLEPGVDGARMWVHGGGFASYHEARAHRTERLDELLRRWEEERAKLVTLVHNLKVKSEFNDGMSSRYQAAITRLARFDQVGPPEAAPVEQRLRMRLRGGRTGKRALVCEQLALTGLTAPFDLEVWYGDRVAVLGSNGSGKSHLLRLLAAGGTDPDREHEPVGERPAPVLHTGTARLGARVRPGWFRQSTTHGGLVGDEQLTLLEVLHRGDGGSVGRDGTTAGRSGMGREQAARALDRYGLVAAGDQTPSSLSGGQRARFGVLLLELSGATMLLLDEPTDNLDLTSAEALEGALEAFEGTVVAVTHDRWFARGFDRFLVVREDGAVEETPEPVWDEARVQRAR